MAGLHEALRQMVSCNADCSWSSSLADKNLDTSVARLNDEVISRQPDAQDLVVSSRYVIRLWSLMFGVCKYFMILLLRFTI